MEILKKSFPFDPSVKNHLLIAGGLALWVFVFLYFTEPLDVEQLLPNEKLIYLPIYGLFASVCYLVILPLQGLLYKRNNHKWAVWNELLLLVSIIILGFVISRSVYFYIVMDQHPNAYSIFYFLKGIYAPAIMTIFPIIAIGRWSFGKYLEKKIDDKKIEIKGMGNYEGIRLHLKDLICIQAADNYIEVNYLEAGELKKQLIRSKLSEIEKTRPELIRTHRSYLVNPTHFRQWKSGNRKFLVVLGSGLEIPVSSTFKNQVEQAVNSTTT